MPHAICFRTLSRLLGTKIGLTILYGFHCSHPFTASVQKLYYNEDTLLTRTLVGIHVSACRNALSKFTMPAMSPTMTEGGIASWKKQPGETFTAGDVILEIVSSGTDPIEASRYTSY